MTQYPELRAMVRGTYDLQQLRMQMGLRLCANFKAKLKDKVDPDAIAEVDGELSEEAKKILDLLRTSYKNLTVGIAKNRTLPEQRGFKGDELISNYAELVLVHQWTEIEKQENRQFRQFTTMLDGIPVYDEYLSKQIGIGPALAGVLLTTFEPHKARHVSSFWKYAGIDVVLRHVPCPHCTGAGIVSGENKVMIKCASCNGLGEVIVGEGRSRRQEHLVERTYISKKGKEATRMGITYNPWLKAKLMGVLAGSFIRTGSPWRKAYDEYKHRLQTDPNRIKITVGEWKKRYEADEDVSNLWTPGRIDMAAKRFMVKCYLADFWVAWRTVEGLPVTKPYREAVLGLPPHRGNFAA